MSYVHVLRGGLLESRHRVHAAVVRADGSLLAFVGQPQFMTFLRSSAKAFQVQPLIPFLQDLNLEAQHLAIAMASHAGDARHVEMVLELLARAGVDSAWLKCGIHAPFDAPTRKEMRVIGLKPTVLQNNCSGKHAAMLAACLVKGLPVEGYFLPEHRLQQEIRQVIKLAFAVPELQIGIDGCSVPCFRVSLEQAARGMARLAHPQSLPEFATGFELAFAAMRQHPHLIAGTNRTDTVLMQSQSNLVSKIGAEAINLMAVRHEKLGDLGIATKIEDGSERVLEVALHSILTQLNVLSHPEALQTWQDPIIKNHAGLEVGQFKAALELEFI
jgi:L-asparaginase II